MSAFVVTVIVLCLLIIVLAIIVLLLRCLFKKQRPIPGSATRVVGVRRLSTDNETHHVTMFPHNYIPHPTRGAYDRGPGPARTGDSLVQPKTHRPPRKITNVKFIQRKNTGGPSSHDFTSQLLLSTYVP
ncbi:uncharacterized protein LOC133194434 [Saccostrea echinata]|uniref:uncharacterized protein LOC133194434 n=1 Tax=Saccostrea echinata TaxID=191078 RepID=UPI002A814F20|nr:uncharacterized protein LOC133194434 [Saccostrea echinata]